MSAFPPPPRLLLGTALLWWGALTGRPLTGLVLALVVEAAHWTRVRWNFDERSQIRAWRLSVLLMLVSLVLIVLDGSPFFAAPRLIGWLPALLLPLQFVQAYGMREAMSPRVFSFFTQPQREAKHGYQADPARGMFHFGQVYLIAILVAATPLWKMADSWLYLPGLVVLTAWALPASRRCRRLQVLGMMTLALGLGLGLQWGMNRTWEWVNSGIFRGRGLNQSPSHFRTAIGRLGEIKQSADIVWRLRPQPGNPPPTLLRTRAYNRYRSGLWSNLPPPDSAPSPPLSKQGQGSLNEDFTLIVPDDQGAYPLRQAPAAELAAAGRPVFALYGSVVNEWPMPLPDSAALLSDFAVESFESNSLGTVMIFPKAPVVEGSVRWGDPGNRESTPWPENDLWIDERERPALRQLLADLRLDKATTLQAKLLLLRRYFEGFQYSLYNTIEEPRVGSPASSTAIGRFLTTTRAGHCEYFATAAALLLRQAGIPTRYAIGFVVAEHDQGRDEWVVRGTHAHAWIRVWDGEAGVWRDFDPTPPDWLAAETRHGWSIQWLFDFVRRANEDFNLWRARPGHNTMISSILLGLGGLGLLFIGRRLWRSKRLMGGARRRRGSGPDTARTPLHRLERRAARWLPPRPPGQPFAAWLTGLEQILNEPAALAEALQLHQRQRFDPAPLDPAAAERLGTLARHLETALRKTHHR